MTNGNNLLILAVDEFFLDKNPAWLNQNKSQILRSRRINNWWAKISFPIEQSGSVSFSKFLRILTDLNYEKVQTVFMQGQFSVLGDTVSIYPILTDAIFQISFLGNTIEKIRRLKPLKVLEEKQEKRLFEKKIERIFLRRLAPGDYIVHLDHGIGVFNGFVFKRNKKYFEIRYAKNDALFVPEKLSEKLSPYIGFSKPLIYRLGGSVWFKIKRKVKEEVEKLARELLDMYARRTTSERRSYGEDDELQKNFEAEFPFELTPDQHQALIEIKEDFQKRVYMDRLLCGDVGFGKTEVAFRAAYKSILEGYQVAMLAPTLILADQHFNTARHRFKNTGVRIEILSRAVNKDKQKEVLRDLAAGRVDFLIGTHRILSDDISFKKLGFLIIDEEQKFGVKQKEKLRHFHGGVDLLSLSATPIPRTLHLALGEIWQASNILTPPLEKRKIETSVSIYDKEKVKGAIARELSRGGQIYYLYNRIFKLAFKKREIEKLIPGIKIGLLHSKMPELDILRIIHDFEAKKFDLLLATTIIENGLDLPLVNTLIVERAEKLGLAQMHQIRGRIGRRGAQSFAHFFYEKANLTIEAKKRLNYIKRFQELGDGYFIALKDLEIRGAGNILGKEQSGYMSAVGLNLYSHLLREAVERISDNK